MLQSDAGVQRPLHISISPPLILRTENKDNYLSAIKDGMRSFSTRATRDKLHSTIQISFRDLIWASNHQSTRWFFVARAARPPGDQLNKLVHMCNDTAARFDLPQLYVGPSPASRSEDHDDDEHGFESLEIGMSTGTSKAASDDADHTDRFHFSLGWSLKAPSSAPSNAKVSPVQLQDPVMEQLCQIKPTFSVLKVKIGNEITSLPFDQRSTVTSKGLFG